MIEKPDYILKLERSEGTRHGYDALYPTLSDFARKLPQNKLMVGMNFHPKELGKIFYVWLQNDAAYLYYDDVVVYSKGTQSTISDEDIKNFDILLQRLIDMETGNSFEIKFGFTNSQKSYWLYKDENGYIAVHHTDTNTKNIRREGGGTAPDPRQDSLDYGARGGNSASPKELGYHI